MRAEFATLFNQRLSERLAEQRGDNGVFLSQPDYETIEGALSRWTAATTEKEEKKALHKEHGSKLYSWAKKYQVIKIGTSSMLCFQIDDKDGDKDKEGEGGDADSICRMGGSHSANGVLSALGGRRGVSVCRLRRVGTLRPADRVTICRIVASASQSAEWVAQSTDWVSPCPICRLRGCKPP